MSVQALQASVDSLLHEVMGGRIDLRDALVGTLSMLSDTLDALAAGEVAGEADSSPVGAF